jgi:hypothetical protein
VDDSIVTFQVAKDGYWHFPLAARLKCGRFTFSKCDARIAKEIVFDMGRTV